MTGPPRAGDRSEPGTGRRRRAVRVAAAALGLTLSPFGAHAQAGDSEASLYLSIGPAAEWPLGGGRANYGGNLAVEKEVIEHWLELEVGITGLATSGRGEFSGDLLFKKPFELSPTLELLVGAGPEIARTFNGRERGTAASAEFAFDIVYLPSEKVGWYVEPSLSVNPANGEKSLSLTAGLLLALP